MLPIIGKALSIRFFQSPVFVVGGSRSGTSVLLQAIGKHPSILSSLGEAPLLTSLGGIIHLIDYGNPKTRDYYTASLKITKKYIYNQLRRLSFEVAMGPDYGCRLLLRELARNPRSYTTIKRWSAKTFPNEQVVKGLFRLYPKMQILYIVRNGVDVVASTGKFKGFKGNTFEENCMRWKKSIFTFRYLNSLSGALVLRHEDLVARPRWFFSRIFNFLGVTDCEEAWGYVSSTIVHPLDQATQKGVSVKDSMLSRKPPYESWSKEQLKTFREICGEAMVIADYELPF